MYIYILIYCLNFPLDYKVQEDKDFSFLKKIFLLKYSWCGDSDGKESTCNAGDLASIPG